MDAVSRAGQTRDHAVLVALISLDRAHPPPPMRIGIIILLAPWPPPCVVHPETAPVLHTCRKGDGRSAHQGLMGSSTERTTRRPRRATPAPHIQSMPERG
eukprot:1384788-Pyramimonas_sp.AAC.1